ncbi:HipA family kinase [Bosea sp. FBZP-16]|uniref:HipA family kinase n=1 Tax=Bosea sp. FBZP-16 TaxID=2065382 RepID=UPI00131A2033|nr:HipA family kinase [Bosea sp. FBZP-16]
MQYVLFPLRAVVEFPKSKPTADALGEVEADDGHRYYIKGDAHGAPVKASEWICTNLAEAVGISAPSPALVELSTGEVVFGSRRVGGVAADVLTQGYLLRNPAPNIGAPPTVGLQRVLSAIYIFDLFLFNDDRHLGNYLSYDDNGTQRLYAFDFSRCLFWSWPWSGFPPIGCNTRIWGRVLQHIHGFDGTVARTTLDRLEALSDDTIEGIFNRMPANWLDPDRRSQFQSFWSGGMRTTRVNELRRGLSDGSLL